jgi:hypothetical protein
MTAEQIPIYNCDGELVEMIDAARLARLDEMGRVRKTVRRRTGRPVRAFLFRMPGEPKQTLLRDCLGTKYSWQQRLDDGNRCFRLRSLSNNRHAEVDLAPLDVRAIFLRVLTDCLVPA